MFTFFFFFFGYRCRGAALVIYCVCQHPLKLVPFFQTSPMGFNVIYRGLFLRRLCRLLCGIVCVERLSVSRADRQKQVEREPDGDVPDTKGGATLFFYLWRPCCSQVF